MNFATTYLGLELKNPFVVGASPFCDDLDMARVLQDSGAAALVMRSLFEEQIAPKPRSAAATKNIPRDPDLFPNYEEYQIAPDDYLRQITRLKQTVSIPVIASLNGHHAGKWTDFSRQIERAGADAIELNFYQVVTDPGVAADEIETEMLEMVNSVSGSVRIPIAAKISPFHTSVAQLAVALELAGAAGVVVFNRFYQPDISVDDVDVQSSLRLSDPGELLLRLRWLAILSPLLRCSLSATGGVHTWSGAVKALLCGAHTVQLVSVVLKHGPHVLVSLLEGLEGWMRDHGYASLDQFRGLLNHARCSDPAAYERANYIRVLQSWKL
jgi:dihydroorotate dehydrogenase (fumarate)